MKVQVIYSSKTGNTKNVAAAIAEVLPGSQLLPVEEAGKQWQNADVLFVGCWADKGQLDPLTTEFLKQVQAKEIAVFLTLGAAPDSDHALSLLNRAHTLIADKNKYAGGFVCQGKVEPQALEQFEKLFPDGGHHPITPSMKEKIHEAVHHPDADDLEHARRFARETVEKLEQIIAGK